MCIRDRLSGEHGALVKGAVGHGVTGLGLPAGEVIAVSLGLRHGLLVVQAGVLDHSVVHIVLRVVPGAAVEVEHHGDHVAYILDGTVGTSGEHFILVAVALRIVTLVVSTLLGVLLHVGALAVGHLDGFSQGLVLILGLGAVVQHGEEHVVQRGGLGVIHGLPTVSYTHLVPSEST